MGISTLGMRRAGVADHTGRKLERTIRIGCPPEELYRFWRNLENLPEFLNGVESVHVLDNLRSHWVVRGPGGRLLDWDAEIVNEHPGEMISWQTLPGADVPSAGTVRFMPTDDGRSTLLRVVLEFHTPGGRFGAGLARLFGRDPEMQLDRDLFRLKEVIEHDPSLSAAG